MKLKFKKLHPEAQKPVYATAGAACFDLHAVIEQDQHGEKPRIITPGSSAHIRTGLAFEIPPGYVLAIYSRSGHGFKNGVRLVNAVGQIDADYRGEVQVGLHNDGRARFQVRHGDRIAQARLEPAPQIELEEVPDLRPTERGTGGFGSTGV